MGLPRRRVPAALLVLLGALALPALSRAQDAAAAHAVVAARYAASDWPAVLAGTRDAFDRPAPDRVAQDLLFMRSQAEQALGRHADCMKTCDKFLATVREGCAPDAGQERSLRATRGGCLFFLHRAAEFRREIEAAGPPPGDPGAARLLFPRAAEEAFTVLPYAGRFRADPRMRRLLDDLAVEAMAAREVLDRRLGAPDGAFPRVLLLVEDSPDGRMPEAPFFTRLAFSADVPTPLVHVVAEAALAFPDLRRTSLPHEFAHALSLGRPVLRRLPAWIEEGMACWLSGETEREIEEALADAASDPAFDPEREIAGWTPRLDGPAARGTVRDQHFGDLAFRGMEATWGRDFVRRFIGACLRKDDLSLFLAREVEGGVPAWQARCAREVRERLARALAGRAELLAAKRLQAAGEWARARTALDTFLAEGPAGPMQGLAALARVDSLRMTGKMREARDAAREWVAAHPRSPHVFFPRLVVIEASGMLGDWETARQAADRFLADYGGILTEWEGRVRAILERAPK